MSSYRGLGVQLRPAKPARPAGVAFFAGLGVLGSLAGLLLAIAQIWLLMRVSVEPSRLFGLCALGLVAALLALWINWGFWELLKWAWWANLLLTLCGAALCGLALSQASALGNALGRALPQLAARANPGAIAVFGIIALLAYHLVVAAYIVSAHAAFGVGTPDERPLWEKAQRR
ncbi:MAG TPA: hypothetical protein PLO33_05915 [Kouleothrix sp.]|uniref:hypothetical protein n=1 Tax=Kouleothrix sp. TaxID=2779161 RepID=UPI002BD41933|nr:hypothetical protein [Kouleothrix sp.]HRC75194.1 hypothetical protein [Kouleothrix sp.]